jgi:hypothetical protein
MGRSRFAALGRGSPGSVRGPGHDAGREGRPEVL